VSRPDREWAKRYGAAKGDHEEAAHFVNARPMRAEAKRELRRARRRLDRALARVSPSG
jgi:hypothetical protein